MLILKQSFEPEYKYVSKFQCIFALIVRLDQFGRCQAFEFLLIMIVAVVMLDRDQNFAVVHYSERT